MRQFIFTLILGFCAAVGATAQVQGQCSAFNVSAVSQCIDGDIWKITVTTPPPASVPYGYVGLMQTSYTVEPSFTTLQGPSTPTTRVFYTASTGGYFTINGTYFQGYYVGNQYWSGPYWPPYGWRLCDLAAPVPSGCGAASPGVVNAHTSVIKPANCNGLGSIVLSPTLTATGGNPPYTYTLKKNDGTVLGSNQTGVFSNVAVGGYFIKVQDSKGNFSTNIYTVGEDKIAPVFSILASSSSVCNGIATTLKADVPPVYNYTTYIAKPLSDYTFAWSNGATTQTISATTSLDHTVTVTDAKNGCSTSKTFSFNVCNTYCNLTTVPLSATGTTAAVPSAFYLDGMIGDKHTNPAINSPSGHTNITLSYCKGAKIPFFYNFFHSIPPNNPPRGGDPFWDVFVDYNQDGDFDDAGENAVHIFTLEGFLNTSFQIPTTAKIGKTRLRVIAGFTTFNAPCSTTPINGAWHDFDLLVNDCTDCGNTAGLFDFNNTNLLNSSTLSTTGYPVTDKSNGAVVISPLKSTSIFIAGNGNKLVTADATSALLVNNGIMPTAWADNSPSALKFQINASNSYNCTLKGFCWYDKHSQNGNFLGIRILKNGVEAYKNIGIVTPPMMGTMAMTNLRYINLPSAGITFKGTDALTVELMYYGAGGNITIDNIEIIACCEQVAPTLGSIGDYVFKDNNANGIQEASDAPIAGVQVQLKNGAGAVLATKTTDANGKYLFDQLAAGQYQVCFAGQAGCVPTTKNAAGSTLDNDSNIDANGVSELITLAAGQNITNIDAGFKVVCDIAPYINGASTACVGSTTPLTAVAGGATYKWNTGETTATINVGPGTYTVTATLGYCTATATKTIVKGLADAIIGGVLTACPSTTLSSISTGSYKWSTGEVTQSINVSTAGNYGLTVTTGSGCTASTVATVTACTNPNTAKLGDFVWNDYNNNGFQDQGEPGIANVIVRLLNTSGTIISTTTTSPTGAYQFANLAADTYCVRFITPTGFVPTKKDQGTLDTNDSDIDPTTGKSPNITLSAGQSNLTIDAGYSRPCNNVTNAGAICCDQSDCGAYDPDPLINLALPTGGTAPIHYIWIKTTTDPATGAVWTAIPNSDMKMYDPPTLDLTTYYVRCAFREGCPIVKETAPVKIEVLPANACGRAVAIKDNENVDVAPEIFELVAGTATTNSSTNYEPFLYPNPTGDAFYIGFPEALSDAAEVTITSQTGQTLLEKTILAGENYVGFDVQNYANGLYFVTIANSKQSPIIKKLQVLKK